MAQHDYNLANQSGADFRADLNNALAAIATVNSGATEPSTTFAHQLWVDTANSLLKIRNAANTDWITFGVSISSSNVFTGNLTGDVTGNLTGNVTGNVTGDLTGNADTATTLATARTISLSGDVAGSASFDGSGDITITTTAQIDSIALGTDTTGDYVQSISGGTGVTITGGTGESSTPVVAIGQAVAVTSNVIFNTVTATDEFIGDLEGGIRFNAKADGALSAGDVVYISGVSGDVPTVAQAKADDASKMPAFGLALSDANDNAELQVVTFGTIENLDTSGVSEGQILYVSTTAGAYTTTTPTGESSQIQNIGKVIRSHASAGSIKVGGAGRSNATGNLNDGNIFIGNASNQASTSTLDTSIVPENTNLYWTTARGESMFDARLATKDTGDLTEGTNLYYTTARVNSDFDTRLATKDTGDLAEGVNLYYTDARANSAFDTRLATKDTDDVSEGSVNLYYTSSRANSDFDTRLATKDTGDLTEGVNLYYTDARFDTRLATKDTDDLTEGTNLYYTQARFDTAFSNKTTSDLTEGTNLYYTDARANSAIDTRVTKSFVDALNIQAASVDANSVALGTDTTGNYIQTITGTANKITVTGSGSESADVTLTLPDDVQIADSLTVAGNLTVNGTLTSLDTTNLDIEDNLFQLNAGLTGSPVNDSGMLINRGDQDNGIFMWDESVDKFTLGLTTADGTSTGNITLNSLGTLVANIEGNITGNVTGTVSDISNHSTSDLTEGSNLYFTNARARSSISASGDISYNSSTGVISFTATAAPVTSVNTLTGAVVLDTGDIAENGNLYFTNARAQAVSINNVVEDTTPQLGGDLASNGNDILFADNDKAIFGAGSDLQIYHDGTDNHIISTTSNINIQCTGGGSINLGDQFSNILLQVNDNSDVKLFHGTTPAEKLATSNTGIDVTGTATMDGLTVSNGTNTTAIPATSDRVSFTAGNSYIQSTGSLFVQPTGDLVLNGSGSEIMRLKSGKVGIGNTFPATALDVTGTVTADGLDVSTLSGDATIFLQNVSSARGMKITKNYDDFSAKFFYSLHPTTEAGSLAFKGSQDSTQLLINSNGDISFYDDTGTSQALFWDASTERLGIGTSSPAYKLDVAKSDNTVVNVGITNANTGTSAQTRLRLNNSGSNFGTITHTGSSFTTSGVYRQDGTYVYSNGAGGLSLITGASQPIYFATNNSERMRIGTTGRFYVGKTSFDSSIEGFMLDNRLFQTTDSLTTAYFNRLTNNGNIVEFRKDTTTVGSLGIQTSGFYIDGELGHAGIRFGSNTLTPRDDGADADDAINLGQTAYRFADIYATNGTINTSDRNEKQDIEALTDAETRVAVAAKGLLRKFKWKSAVEEKGDEARTHFGIIAQDLQDAFTAEGLDAGDYAMFISSTWTDDDGVEQTRLGVRYSELLAFIIAAI